MDLRRKIDEAVLTGTPKVRVARSFGVGLWTVKRSAGRAERGEEFAPRKPSGKGRKVDGRTEMLLGRDLEERPMATLPQRRELLARVAGLSVSESTLSRLLRRMGFTPKNGAWTRASATSS